jgi:hypothetical protein
VSERHIALVWIGYDDPEDCGSCIEAVDWAKPVTDEQLAIIEAVLAGEYITVWQKAMDLSPTSPDDIKLCPDCGGSGKVPAGERSTLIHAICPTCQGKGRV